jgi:hypothetical protein
MSQEVSVRGTGGAVFAGILLIIGGALWMLQGLAGIVKGTSYLENADYWITTSAGTWGWIHLVVRRHHRARGRIRRFLRSGLGPLARNPHRDGFGGRELHIHSVRAVVGLDDHLHRPVGHPFAVRTSTLTRLSLITSVVLSAWLCWNATRVRRAPPRWMPCCGPDAVFVET